MQTLRNNYPKLFITEITNDQMKFNRESNHGYIEYKRTLLNCTKYKIERYATQMRWRISENIKKQCATYYIGINDNGTIYGLTNKEIIICVNNFMLIAKTISASVFGLQIIHINNKSIIRIGVKIKKIDDNYLVDFKEKIDI